MTKTSRKPKAQPQTMAEIVSSESEMKNSKLYKAQSVALTNARISNNVAVLTNELNDVKITAPITLNDFENLRKRTILYLQGCQAASTLPSIIGLARSLGMSRQALYKYKSEHPDHPSAHWLEIVSDAFADTLSQAALRNDVNGITAIFIAKAQYSWTEAVDIKVHSPLDFEQKPTVDEIKEKYKDIIDLIGDE